MKIGELIVTIRLKKRVTGIESNPVNLEDVIFNQNDIEFTFNDETTLPYKDFLFNKDDYEVIVRVR